MVSRPRILVVDDIEANIIAMEALLSSLDCEVVRATSGNEALIELLKRQYAVVLLDVQMPEMDGFEVARLARSNPRAREVPIIFVTAMLETPDSIFEGYESGAVDVLFKPVNAHVLLSKVRIFLELYRSKQKLAAEVAAHERTLAELDAFNYSVSHDLRAPLRPLAGFTKVLLEDYSHVLDDEGKRLLGRIEGAAVRMEQLIADLLRLSQISRTRLEAKHFDLAAVARKVMSDITSADPERNVEFLCPPTLEVYGDERLMCIALENLLRNAWKFSSKKPRATIEVGCKQQGPDGERIYFVKDDGAGFDSKRSESPFTPFQRMHAKTDFDGTGIGLAIVQRIIHHHRGTIWADAVPDQGATFSFTLGG
ncbi:MAG: response regulator [Labilithrix sp.]|nr:response regulator [Labilithrix sp.]MCW5816913.1 response regulator [Labilithrix sp.]